MPTSPGLWGSLTFLPFPIQLPSQAGLSLPLLLAHSLTEYFIPASIFWLASSTCWTCCTGISTCNAKFPLTSALIFPEILVQPIQAPIFPIDALVFPYWASCRIPLIKTLDKIRTYVLILNRTCLASKSNYGGAVKEGGISPNRCKLTM